MRRLLAICGLLVAVAASSFPAFAEKRVALVIGEDVYRNLPLGINGARGPLRGRVIPTRPMHCALFPR